MSGERHAITILQILLQKKQGGLALHAAPALRLYTASHDDVDFMDDVDPMDSLAPVHIDLRNRC
jgi:hypothetical protein